MQKKLITLYPNRNDCTSFYRGAGVINELNRLSDEIFLIEKTTISLVDLIGVDAVFFQRPFTPDHLNVVQSICKVSSINKPVIIDYDDLLTEVPVDNGFHQKYKDKNYQNIVREVIKLVDFVFVSTKHLQDSLGLTKENSFVVPNAINDYLFNFELLEYSYSKNIVWRGGASHSEDFKEFLEPTLEIIKSNKDFTFYFLGYLPSQELLKLKNVVYKPSTCVASYHAAIKDLKPSLFFVPLSKSNFNLSKSNIAKLEATYAGAVTLAPDWYEWDWRQDGSNMFMYRNKENYVLNFEAILENIRKKSSLISNEYLFNFKYVKQHYLLSYINKKRVAILRSFLNGNRDYRNYIL